MSVPDPATTKWVPLQGIAIERMAYWGAYESTRTYNDGDCAIGTDGILYCCVKNGTVGVAPVTWPGGPSGAPAYPDTVGHTDDVLTVNASGAAPVWRAPAPQGADLIYNGQFPSGGPSYTDGDIVIGSDGLAYICVRPTTAAPTPWAGTSVGGAPGYGTSLPTGPVNGQEYILVDSLTAPTWQWRFRYNALATSTYKWEFIGGRPLCSAYAGIAMDGAATTYTAVPAVAPVTLPRVGDYSLRWGANLQNLVYPAAYNMLLRPYRGTVATMIAVPAQFIPTGTYAGGSVVMNWVVPDIPAASVIGLAYSLSVANSSRVENPWLEIQPLRVS
jgi:hypothetical protein